MALFFGRSWSAGRNRAIVVRRLHLTMNKTNDGFPLGVLGAFASSGFFRKPKVRATKRAADVYRIRYEAATPAQTARLNGVFGREMSSHLRS